MRKFCRTFRIVLISCRTILFLIFFSRKYTTPTLYRASVTCNEKSVTIVVATSIFARFFLVSANGKSI